MSDCKISVFLHKPGDLFQSAGGRLFVFSPSDAMGLGQMVSEESGELNSLGVDELTAAVGNHGGEPETGFNPITGWGNSGEPLV